MALRMGQGEADCPVTKDRSDRLVRLPFYNSFGRSDQDRVIEAILEFGQNIPCA
jgi:dTDP-4-amino-4,6-dideoxygalactose transaminase